MRQIKQRFKSSKFIVNILIMAFVTIVAGFYLGRFLAK